MILIFFPIKIVLSKKNGWYFIPGSLKIELEKKHFCDYILAIILQNFKIFQVIFLSAMFYQKLRKDLIEIFV